SIAQECGAFATYPGVSPAGLLRICACMTAVRMTNLVMNLLLLLAVAVPLSWLALLGVMTLGAVINVIGIAVSPACERVSPCFAIASSALHSMHPIRVCQHVHAHQSKYDEHNHSGHNPHHTHFGFFVVSFVLVRHLFLLNLSSTVTLQHDIAR